MNPIVDNIMELFENYQLAPTLAQRVYAHQALRAAIEQAVGQGQVPEGYALIGIDALKAWGKYDLVREDCQYPTEPQPQPKQEPVEMSPEFTDTARAALLWVLWHHQGASSPVWQPIRFALGIGAHDRLTDTEIKEAKRWAEKTGSTTAEFHAPQPQRDWVYLTDEEIDDEWEQSANLDQYEFVRACVAKFREKNGGRV